MKWNDLTMSQRNDLMKLYLKHGITSLDAMKEHYNSFADGGKIPFKTWKARMQAKYPDIEFDNQKAGYDYETYFNNNYEDAIRQLTDLQHFPDTYKLPNHPTFSNESIYSRGPVMGGNWINDSTFTPSSINRQYHPNIYKENRNYTEREIYGNELSEGGPMRVARSVNYNNPPIEASLDGNGLQKSLNPSYFKISKPYSSNWSPEMLETLQTLYEAAPLEFSLEDIFKAIAIESRFDKNSHRNGSSFYGPLQLNEDAFVRMYNSSGKRIYDEYKKGTRSDINIARDVYNYMKWMDERLSSKEVPKTFGRIMINQLAPYASLSDVPDEKTYNNNIKYMVEDGRLRNINKKSTWREIMEAFDTMN